MAKTSRFYASMTMNKERDLLSEEIRNTLDNVCQTRLGFSFLFDRHEFWQRCSLITPVWRTERIPRVFVDGIEGGCRWNSWKVFTSGLEIGLSLWLGFAFHRDRWVEHCWCTLADGRIVETTGVFGIYYGAALQAEEHIAFGKRYGNCGIPSIDALRVYTMVNGHRDVALFTHEEYGHTIGRERDPQTRAIKEGLGRC